MEMKSIRIQIILKVFAPGLSVLQLFESDQAKIQKMLLRVPYDSSSIDISKVHVNNCFS